MKIDTIMPAAPVCTTVKSLELINLSIIDRNLHGIAQLHNYKK